MAVTRPRANTRRRPSATPSPGFAPGANVTVKGARADAQQLTTIDGVLAQASSMGASRRVMVAAVMCITQESTARPLGYGDAAGPDSRGPFQQRAPWGPLSVRMDPRGSARLFLEAWARAHGSVKNAPSPLTRAINKVQISAHPDAYAQWQAEAERTVAAWDGTGAGATGGAASDAVRQRAYEFTRGEKNGERESSWDAAGRLAEEVGWLRWAAGNTLYFVSAQELRQAAPAVAIRGDEDWLVSLPAWSWSSNRLIAECTLDVMTDRFAPMPGAVVVLAMGDPLDGRWLVHGVSGERLDSPVATLTLRRPTLRRAEPAPETETVSSGDGEATGGEGADGILAACMRVHQMATPYVWGGGHARAGTPDRGTGRDPGIGFDCSGGVGAALAFMGHGYSVGGTIPGSGAMASGWGQPGRGRSYTVWANSTHVYLELHGAGEWKRLDTSAHGDGGRGARLRRTSRSSAGFTARHWPGF